MFERTLADFYLQRWLEHLPEAERPKAVAHARQLALRHQDLTSAATLLMRLGDAAAAEARLGAQPGRVDGNNYDSLVALAKALRANECLRGETVVYRALLFTAEMRARHGRKSAFWARANGARRDRHDDDDETP